MTISWEGGELFSMSEAIAAIEEYGKEEWLKEDVLRAALMGRVGLLCKANQIGVIGWKSDDPQAASNNEMLLDLQPYEHKYSGYFYPLVSKAGESYLKALINGVQPTQGITQFLAHGDDNDSLKTWSDKGVRPALDDFYMQGVDLSLLIANLIQRNQYRYISIFVAAEQMAIADGGQWLKLRSRFGSLHSPYHISRIVQTVRQGAFPIWKKKANGHWDCHWGKEVYSTSQVLVTDIEHHFGLLLSLENRSLPRENLQALLDDKEGLDAIFVTAGHQPPTPSKVVAVRKIYDFIVNNVATDFDFSAFDMSTVKNITGIDTKEMLTAISPIYGKNLSIETFRRDYLQKASFIFKQIAKKPK